MDDIIQENKDRIKELEQRIEEKKAAKNPPAMYYRRIRVAQQTPTWLTKIDHLIMRDFKDRCKKLKNRTGKDYHVDHMVPIYGSVRGTHVVCGLHVPWNLQIIPAEVNYHKGWRFWPDMWDYGNIDGM